MTEWPLVSLRRVASFHQGAGFPHQYQGDPTGDLPFVKVSDMNRAGNEQTVVSAENWVSIETASILGAVVVSSGSILFPKVGAALLGNKRRLSGRPMVFDNNIMAMTPITGDPRFWYYWMTTRDLTVLSNPGPVPSINAPQVAAMTMEMPPVATQRRIADFLDRETARIDALVDKKRRLIGLLEEKRTALIERSILDDESSTRPIWHLARYVNGYPFKPSDFTQDGLPVIRIRQLLDPNAPVDRFDGPIPERVRIDTGDLIFSWSATLAVRDWDRGDALLNQHLFRVVPAQGVDQGWLRWGLEGAIVLFSPMMHGSAMTHITQQMMKDVSIPLPSIDRQRDVARRLETTSTQLEDLRDLLHDQMSLLSEYREALITAAVTGEIDVDTFNNGEQMEEVVG